MSNRNLSMALAAALALAACSQEPEPAPAPASPAPVVTPSLPAPDQALFSELFGKACPGAEKVNTAACKRAGFGSEEVICEYGLGEDTYLRNSATLAQVDGAWAIKDAETVCKAHLDNRAG
ncbi:hypothetical protein [Qipengyuania sediminis]|uniref:hypothetical protein n=1 Tax=Qipengyuania sediminis TaxID=1532023 RepID=UPI001F1063F4|nr:hypothetical protein [Qipengyuania sediminis]